MDLSVLILTYNEENHIKDCLKSVEFADEIIVVDSYSEDSTGEIVKNSGANLILNSWPGYAEQRHFGIKKCSGDWVLMVDADERVTEKLKDKIIEITKKKNEDNIYGYKIPRKNFAFGRHMKHMWPARSLRLFKKNRHKVTLDREVHEKILVDGKVKNLKEHMIHYTYDTIDQYINKMKEYTTLIARQKYNENPQKSKTKIRLYSIVRFFHMFLDKYISRGGFRDGVYGFYLSLLSGLYAMTSELKIIEIMEDKE